MSQQHGAGAIPWRDWGADAFQAARAEEKPVLLTLGATWCHWCHVMDETAYADPRVIELVNSHFIPVRVDVDQRPDIALRYNQGTYPSVAFLTSGGELLAGRPYTPADEMAALLEQISSGGFVPESGRRAESVAKTGAASVAAVQERLTELYDAEFGGFGVEPKQPPWEALRFLAARYGLTGERAILGMVENTLQGMWHGIYDRKDQGFFRYSVSRDWKAPHYEKMLVSNASLAIAYSEAYQITGKTGYKAAVEGILRYLSATLFSLDDGLFYASQDADEPFYQMSWKDRDANTPPPVDRTFYAGWNALVAEALIRAADACGGSISVRRDLGYEILEQLWERCWTSAGGLQRLVGGGGETAAIFADQVNFLRAWLTAYQSSGRQVFLQRAVEVATTAERLFGSADGGCYDTAPLGSFEAALLPPERSVIDNGRWAEALTWLSHLTDDPEYAEQAAVALSIFESVVPGKSYLGAHASRRMEEDEEALFLPAGAAWGRAKDLMTQGPVCLVLVGDSASPGYRRLHRSALRIYAPHKVLRPLDTGRDAGEIRRLGFPLRAGVALYACMGDRCLAPLTTPGEVRELARTRPWADW